MQAQESQQSESKQGQQATKEQKQVKTGSSSLRNTPAPLHALPSGRIGQLLIRRSGRVHLRLLTEVAAERKEKAVSEASEETDTSQRKTVALGPAYKLRSEVCTLQIGYSCLLSRRKMSCEAVGASHVN